MKGEKTRRDSCCCSAVVVVVPVHCCCCYDYLQQEQQHEQQHEWQQQRKGDAILDPLRYFASERAALKGAMQLTQNEEDDVASEKSAGGNGASAKPLAALRNAEQQVQLGGEIAIEKQMYMNQTAADRGRRSEKDLIRLAVPQTNRRGRERKSLHCVQYIHHGAFALMAGREAVFRVAEAAFFFKTCLS